MSGWRPIEELDKDVKGHIYFRGGRVQFSTHAMTTENGQAVVYKNGIMYDLPFGDFPIEVAYYQGDWWPVNSLTEIRKSIYIGATEFCVRQDRDIL